MKTVVFFLFLLVGLSINTFAYPISPRPLRKLVIESEHIIVGYVASTYNNENKEDDNLWGRAAAKIAVLEQLKGKIKEDSIEVLFNPYMICPAPARYTDSTFVIAFIDKKGNQYYTHALSYGAKTLTKAAIEIYKARIAEIQNLLKIENKDEQYKAIVEWLVTCAENETTRWEGVFELSPQSDFMSYYSRDKKEGFDKALTAAQKERLKTAILNTKNFSYEDFGLVDLVYIGNEKEIDTILINRLALLKEKQYWLIDDFMDRLKHRNNSTAMQSLLADFDKIKWERNKNEEKKKMITQFIALVEK